MAAAPWALPPDHEQRVELHNEVHARPSARIRQPALVIYLAVSNTGVERAEEWAHLCRLPGQGGLALSDLDGSFLRLRWTDCTLKWERHSEFSRYTLVQSLPSELGLDQAEPELLGRLQFPPGWLAGVPGRSLCAIKLVMLESPLTDLGGLLARARTWLGEHAVVASVMGNQGHSMVVTDFLLRPSGFERMLVIAPPGTSETRAGRISQRLLELETYRMMALRGLPQAKALAPFLGQAERQLADITARLEIKDSSDQALLDQLVALAAGVERVTAESVYRFSATRAYGRLVEQRLGELREQPIAGTQTLGEFMQRRLSPALATVEASAARLDSLAERVSRASALLRTRVDIATEAQNQLLLERLTEGQAMQLRLQTTVEGLSIAAISYYVISLLLYLAKGAKAAGMPIQPELAAGALVPLVLWGVWRTTRRIHARLQHKP